MYKGSVKYKWNPHFSYFTVASGPTSVWPKDLCGQNWLYYFLSVSFGSILELTKAPSGTYQQVVFLNQKHVVSIRRASVYTMLPETSETSSILAIFKITNSNPLSSTIIQGHHHPFPPALHTPNTIHSMKHQVIMHTIKIQSSIDHIINMYKRIEKIPCNTRWHLSFPHLD